jgi:hypothetical protein
MKINWKLGIMGAVAGVLTPVARTWLAKISTLTLTFSSVDYNVRQQVTGVSDTIGEKLLGMVGGNLSAIPFSNYLLFAASGFLIVLLGNLLYNYVPSSFKINNDYGKVASIFFLGSIVATALLIIKGIPAGSAFLSMAVNSVALGLVIGLVYKIVLKKPIPV